MERQEFLKKAGAASILASFPIFLPARADVASADDDDDDDGARQQHRFYLVFFSGVGGGSIGVPPPANAPSDAIVLGGCGSFNTRRISGGGEYVRTNLKLAPNAPVLDTGSWKARRLLEFEPDPGPPGGGPPRTWGVVTPGHVLMEVKLISASDCEVTRGTLDIVCNVGPAGIMTGFGPEGFVLELDDGTKFVQLTPPAGLTLITAPAGRKRHDDDDD
jgi:hypothetical protein